MTFEIIIGSFFLASNFCGVDCIVFSVVPVRRILSGHALTLLISTFLLNFDITGAHLQKIAELEAEYAKTQKNKATNYHLGLIKAKLAKLRRELIEPSGGGGGKGGEGFDVAKSGDTRVGLVGFPSVGKSTLLTKLTGTFSEAASYEFTTLTAIPGTLHYRGARIQVVDLPGIIEGAKDGKGRGRQVISAARTCNIILVVLDVAKPATHKILIERELDGFGIRLNQEPPRIMFRKKDKGGINFQAFVPQTTLDAEAVTAICREYKIHNADVHLRCDATVDQIIDVVEGNRKVRREVEDSLLRWLVLPAPLPSPARPPPSHFPSPFPCPPPHPDSSTCPPSMS
jgi:small GTP-binding protein